MIKVRLLSIYNRGDSKYTIASLRLASYSCDLDNVEMKIFTLPLDFEEDEMEDLLKHINEENIDLLALSAYVWTWDIIRNISLKIERKNNIRIIVGGPEVINRSTDNWVGDEIFVYGEGEKFFKQICQFAIQRKNIEEILKMTQIANGTKIGNHYIIAKEGKLNYSQCAYCEKTFSQLEIKDFSTEYAYYETTRGCPYKCGYCGHKFRNKVVSFDEDFLKKEISFFGDIGMKELFIIDPIIGGTKENGKKIFRLFQKLSPQTKIIAYLRPEYLDEEYIEILADSNISELRLGIQTINKNVPNWIRNNDINVIINVLPKLCHIGIPWRAELIVGLPGDNMDGLKRSLKFLIDEVKPTIIHAYHLTVLKETELYRLVHDSVQWIRRDENNFRALESYSYSKKELQEMIVYSVLFTSLYNRYVRGYQGKKGKFYNDAPDFKTITTMVEEKQAEFQLGNFPQYEDGQMFWKKIFS